VVTWFKSHHKLRGFWDRIWLALVWRYGTHSLMVLLTLLTERIPAPHLSDRLLDIVPYLPTISRYNFHLWILCYAPVAFWLWRADRDRFVNFLYLGGVLSLLRGICVAVTSLGPVRGPDVNAGRPLSELIPTWIGILNPVSALMDEVPNLYLTKDLFFSGHTASTFLLWLYCRRYPRLSIVALVAHIAVVIIVFLSHIHYTIDVIGAWAITYTVYGLTEERGMFERRRRLVRGSD
jgi:hypothetical protein